MMGGKRRNNNKTNREDRAFTSSQRRQKTLTEDANDDLTDVESVYSHYSQMTIDEEGRSVIDDVEDVDSEDMEDQLTDRLGEYLDNASHKNISIRMAALKNIYVLLCKSYMAEDVEKYKATLVDLIEKNLRRTDRECLCASLISSAVAIQLGTSVSEGFENIVRILGEISYDPSRAEDIRACCASALAICTYFSIEQPSSIESSISVLRSIWISIKAGCPSATLFSAAAYGWILLVHDEGRKVVESAVQDEPKLCTFIEGTQMDMRVSAGEVVAALYEAAVSTIDETFKFPNQHHLLEILAGLATDSVKYRAKKDRKVQRSSFRQIYNAVEQQEWPSFDVKFDGEVLTGDSYGVKLLYDAVCSVLKSGTNAHLKSNILLREVFDLGPVVDRTTGRTSKLQRRAVQNAIDKSRDQQRAKQRGKRTCQ